MERSALAVIVVALAVAGCSGSGRHTTSTHHEGAPTRPAGGPVPIEIARSSSPLFGIFPDHVATRPCRIPRGGPALGSLRGTCSTRLRQEPRGRSAVQFVEHWRGTGILLARFTHTWRVLVGPSGRVLATRTAGAEAPQLWR